MTPSMEEGEKTEGRTEEKQPKIVFDHVTFSYGGAQEASLEDISFTVEAGETVGVIGGTGSGKSTLMNLIPRFYDTQQGQILVDGQNVREYSFQELREKRGLCYTVYSYVADHADTGLLGIYTATGSEQEAQALDAVRNIVSDLAEHGPTQEELDRAREQAQAGLLMGLESVQSRMSHLGASGLLYGRVREVDELLECYEQVTRQELRQLAQHLFRPQGASLSAVGRVRAAEEYAGWLAH